MRAAGVALALAGLVASLAACSRDDDPDPVAATTTTESSGTADPAGGAGASGVGDPYFPQLGNGGYDVAHYDLDLTWLADLGELAGVATVEATATQDLSRFNLDLVGMEVSAVLVEGEEAEFARDGRELTVTPPEPIDDGDRFTTVVTYRGEPTPVEEGTDLFEPGWQTDGREAFVVSEPSGAATFFPGNDHPVDKATYAIHVTAPSDQTVAANGLAAEPVPGEGTTRWSFTMDHPMATYLVQVAIGDYELVDGGEVDGVTIRHALHRDGLEGARAAVASTGELLEFLTGVFGPYPFDQYGVVAIDESIGFALETQTLTVVPYESIGTDFGSQLLLLHELAHQWVGDSVSPASWKDIWLNEGFATYAEWLYEEAAGGADVATIARSQRGEGLAIPAGDPGPQELFLDSVYKRGALTLQAVREVIGDDDFF
ncbi:MAG: M1 family metallopeptidase, partial [Actinomycetota bacterium]|nr:M1 family metallopeptidase [Actinomycetota bacterium]